MYGMRSAVDASSLPPGYFNQLTNIRFTDNSVRIRNGALKCTSAVPVAAASYRGSWIGTINNVTTIIAAFKVSTKIRLYKVVDPTASIGTWTWTELTASSGAFGDTRFATDAFVDFTVVTDPNDKLTYLVAQNGTDDPRVYNATASNAALTRVQKSITAPVWASSQTPTFAIPSTFPLADTTKWSVTSSAGSMVVTKNGASTNDGSLTMAETNSVNGVTVTIDFGANVTSLSGCNTFNMMWLNTNPTTATYSPLGYCDLDIHDTLGGTQRIYDKTVGTDVYRQTEQTFTTSSPLDTDGSKVYTDTIDISSIPDVNKTHVDKIIFTVTGNHTGAVVHKLLAVFGGGSGQTTSTYTISYFNSGSRAESAGVSMLFPASTPLTLTSFGVGAATYTNASSITIGADGFSFITFAVSVPFFQVSAADLASGVNYLNVYRQDDGAIDSYLAFSTQISEYVAAVWQQKSPYTGNPAAIPYHVTDTTSVNDLQTNIVAPLGSHEITPIGTTVLGVNNRLYVGGVNHTQVWISYAGSPFRFLEAVNFFEQGVPDLNSATLDDFPGETITQLISLPGSYVGISPVIAMTTQAIWRIEGTDSIRLSTPTLVGQHGCPYPMAWTTYQGQMWILDSERQIREIVGGLNGPAITLKKVSDKLRSGVVTNCCMTANYDKLYITYKHTGESTFVRCLIYDLTTGEWCEDELASGDMAGLQTWENGLQRQILAFSDVGNIYELEARGQTTDDGSAIVVDIISREFHNKMWNLMGFGRMGIVTDQKTGTLTSSRIIRDLPATVDGEINLVTSGPLVWRYDRSTTNVSIPKGATGISCKFRWTGAMTGGANIMALVAEIKNLTGDGADVA